MRNLYGANFCRFVRVLFIMTLIIGGCAKAEKEVKREKQAVPVTVGEVSTRNIRYILNQVGTLEANQAVTVRSEVEGKVNKILFAEGKKVRKGQTLVILDHRRILAEIQNLEARIRQLEIRMKNKERTLERHRSLAKKGVVSKQKFDDLQSETHEIRAQIQQARADLTQQKEVLSYTTLKAPFSGVSGQRDFSVGHYLKKGDPVVSIVALNPLEITFKVPERHKAALSVGKEVLLRVDAYPDQRFKGTLFFISPEVDAATRSFTAKARVSNEEHLLNPGMFARVEVVMEVHENASTVPWESVIQTEDEAYIYLIEGDRVRQTPILLGKVTSQWAEILTPALPSGSRVVLEGKFAVQNGAKVNIKQNGTASPKIAP